MIAVRQYVAELRFCLMIGADSASKLRLATETLRFHAANGIGRRMQPYSPEEPRLYRVHVRNRRHNLWMRTFSGDMFIFHEVMLGRVYNLPELMAPQPQIIVDLGANIGLTTLFWYGLFGAATYVCVEPNPENLVLLERNVAGLRARVQVIGCAVSNSSGTATFDPTRWSWGGRLDAESKEGYEVNCKTMDQIMLASGIDHIDLLKVDIESGVEAVFGQNNKWLAKVGAIVAELWPGYGPADFTADMAPFGFMVTCHGASTVTAVRHT